MSVIVYIETQDQEIKKSSLEVASYGRAIADAQETSLVAVTFGLENGSALKQYGVDTIINVPTEGEQYFNADRYSSTLAKIADNEGAKLLIQTLMGNALFKGTEPAGGGAGGTSNVIAPISNSVVSQTDNIFAGTPFTRNTEPSIRDMQRLLYA